MTNETYLIPVFLTVAIAVLIYLYLATFARKQKTYTVKKRGNYIVVNDCIQIEKSDMKYYSDLQAEYNTRKSWYQAPPVIVNEDGEDYDYPELHYHLDDQNVHDTMIQDNLKTKFETQSIFSGASELNEIVEYSGYDNKVSGVLDKISNRNAHLDNFKEDEVSIIKRVWANGDDNVRKELLLQLKDCEDSYGMLFCPTGVASRVVSALYINNPGDAPKSRDILNQEILHKYSVMYSRGMEKDEIVQKIIDEYDGVYSREKINGLISEWIDHIH